MKDLALRLPGYGVITPPPNIPAGTDAPSNALQLVVTLLMLVVIVASLIFTLYGGVLWITSAGDKQKIDRARRTITYAIIGLIVTILAFVIIRIVGSVLGVSFLTTFGIGDPAPPPPVSSIGTRTECLNAGGYCLVGNNCPATHNGIGVCNQSPITSCCR